MKRYLYLLSVLLLLFALAGCLRDEPVPTVPATETTQAVTVPTTQPPADPAAVYAAALEVTGSNAVRMEIDGSRITTVAGQSFTATMRQIISYWNMGTENFLAHVLDHTDLTTRQVDTEEYYSGGKVYLTFRDMPFTEAMEPDVYTSRYPSVTPLDSSLYTLTLEDGGKVIRFTDATAMESWIAGSDAQPICVEATVTLDDQGGIAKCEYTAEYTYGPGTFEVDYTILYSTPGNAPSLPEDTAAYTPLDSIDSLWLLDTAFGHLLQAKQYSVRTLSSVQSQAAGMVINQQNSIDTYVTGSGTDYLFESSLYAMDSTGNFEQDVTEKFIDGQYTYSLDGGEELSNSNVSEYILRTAAVTQLVSGLSDLEQITQATITDLGSLILIEYSYPEEQATEIQQSFCQEYFGDPKLLDDLATAYATNRLEYYLALDKYTLLPTALGHYYEGSHTIEGYDYLLVEQFDQSFDLASLSSHDAIYEEPAPDTEPEVKPTPLFYHVTGPNGQEMWLFGTIHVGDDRTGFLPQEIRDALLASDALAVECDTKGFDAAVEEDESLQDQVSDCYFYKDGTIGNHLTTEGLYEDAVKVLKAVGGYFYNSEYQKASLWSSSIDNYYLSQGHSLIREKGVESRLEKIAEDNGIPLWEVESSLFQIRMLTGYSDALQEFQLYNSVFSHGKDGWESTQELYELWCAGDEEALIQEMKREVWAYREEDLEETEDMTDEDLKTLQYIRDNLDSINVELEKIYWEYITAMESDRNAGMLQVAKGYLESGDTVFFAVGLAHLLAEDGLVFTLREAGYTVELVKYK